MRDLCPDQGGRSRSYCSTTILSIRVHSGEPQYQVLPMLPTHPGRLSGSHAGVSEPGSQLPAFITTLQPLLAVATRLPRKPRVAGTLAAARDERAARAIVNRRWFTGGQSTLQLTSTLRFHGPALYCPLNALGQACRARKAGSLTSWSICRSIKRC